MAFHRYKLLQFRRFLHGNAMGKLKFMRYDESQTNLCFGSNMWLFLFKFAENSEKWTNILHINLTNVLIDFRETFNALN